MGRLSLNNVRLGRKLLLLYFLSVFFPLVFTNLDFYSVTTHHVRNQRETDIALAMDRIRTEFQGKIDVAVGISTIFYADGLILEALERDYASTIEYLDAFDSYIRPSMAKYGSVYKTIHGLSIYTDNPTVLGAGGIGALTEQVRRSAWFNKAMAAPPGVPVLVHAGSDGSRAFSIVRKLDVLDRQSRYLKMLKIDIHPDAIKQALHHHDLRGRLDLLNEAGSVEYEAGSSADEHRDPGVAELSGLGDMHEFVRGYENIDYLRGWTVRLRIPEEQMLAEVRKSRATVFYLACANFVLPTLIILWISRSLHGRLLRIVRQMKKLKNGGSFELLRHDGSTDEIGHLTLEFNRMIQHIQRLINDVYLADIRSKESELQRRRAQLHALQSQINPHFLFNVLETMRMRSVVKREWETAKMVAHMAKLFRKSLAWGNDWVTVRQEIDLITSFLELQKYRFDEKLQYRIEVDEAACDLKIPKMIYLPFVENASIHGIESLEGQGRITLAVALDGDRLDFKLTDNGKGMERSLLRQLLSETEPVEASTTGERIGIRNVLARLRLYYGEEAELRIYSGPDRGTAVTIRAPAIYNLSDNR